MREAASILKVGIWWLLQELREEETVLYMGAKAAVRTTVLGGAVGAKDIPAEFFDTIGRLEAERGSRLVIERSKTEGEKEQFGAWYCMVPTVAPTLSREP